MCLHVSVCVGGVLYAHYCESFNQASEGVLTGKCSKRERSNKDLTPA